MRELSTLRPGYLGGRPRSMTCALASVWCLLAITRWSSAATLTFSIVAVNDSGSNEVVVQPGAEVPYILTALITYEGTQADNAGLAFFSVDVRTDLQVVQLPIDSFDPGIALAFPILQSRGTPREGPVAGIIQDILDIGGSQDTFAGTQSILDVALLQTQVLGQGRLLTPAVEGSFTAGILDTSTANVFRPNSNSVFQPQIALGPALKITTQIPTNGSDGNGTDGGTDGQTDGNGSDNQQTTTTTTALPGATALTLFAVVAGLIFVALWGGGLLWLFGPLLLVILLVMVLLGQW